MRSRTKTWGAVGVATLVAVLAIAYAQLPAIGAGGLLHPARRVTNQPVPASCAATDLAGEGITLRGWRCPATADSRRGTIIYLHGVADNRGSSIGVIERFTRRGYDVIAYDSRAHGESGGDACTYGVFEKRDLRSVVDTIAAGPVVLIGTSLGAAVALQEAADDPRVTAVVAAETFSDLRTVASERAPFFFSRSAIDRTFRLAEEQARLAVDSASPVAAAPRITARVLLIHGASDIETLPAHSQRVYEALRGPKRFLLVPDAGHNSSLRADVWPEVERWLDNSHSFRNE